MKELVFLIFIVGMATVIGLVTLAIRQYRIDKYGWKVHLEDVTINGELATEVWLVRGSQTHFCGRSLRRATNYTEKLFEIEGAAESLRNEWNSTDKVSKGLYHG